MSDQLNKEYQATPAATLEQQIMNPNFPKNEREWWAADEIERLRAALREDARDFANRIELLEGLVRQAQSIIDPCSPEKCHQWQKDARAALEERT